MVLGQSTAVIVLYNQDDRRFLQASLLTNVPTFKAMNFGDLNGDGLADLVLGGEQIRTYMGQANGALTPTAFQMTTEEVSQVAIDPASVAASDLLAENLTTGQTSSAASVLFGDDNKTLTFQLPAMLADGNYRFTLPAGAVSDLAGNFTTVQSVLDDSNTFVLAGDANRDRAVNFDDLVILAQHYGRTLQTFSRGNFDYDSSGAVEFDDLTLLAQRYNASLAPAVRVGGKGRVAATVL